MQKYFYWLPPYFGVLIGLLILKNAWAGVLGFHLGILLSLILAKPNISPKILFKSKNIKWVLINIFLCGSSGFVIYFARSLFGITENISLQLAELELNKSTLIPFIVYFSLVNPFLEEYFWRAVFGSETKSFYFGDLAYAGYHGLVLFGKIHPFAIIFAFVCLTIISWFWRQVQRQEEGLLAPVLGHMMADFSIMIAVYFLII